MTHDSLPVIFVQHLYESSLRDNTSIKLFSYSIAYWTNGIVLFDNMSMCYLPVLRYEHVGSIVLFSHEILNIAKQFIGDNQKLRVYTIVFSKPDNNNATTTINNPDHINNGTITIDTIDIHGLPLDVSTCVNGVLRLMGYDISNIHKQPKVYISTVMTGYNYKQFYDFVMQHTSSFNNVEFTIPDTNSNRTSRGIVSGDINAINHSDAVLCVMHSPSIGAAMELCYATIAGKPRVVIAPSYLCSHPWIIEHSDAVIPYNGNVVEDGFSCVLHDAVYTIQNLLGC